MKSIAAPAAPSPLIPWSLRWLARGTSPIFVGPWWEEVGTECLYWIPFVRAWQQVCRVDPTRLYIISRGGASAWYGMGHAVELYDYWPLDLIRLESLKTQHATRSQKQVQRSVMDDALYPTIAARLGVTRYRTLHPSSMYRALSRWLRGVEGIDEVFRRLRLEPIPTCPLPVTVPLPETYLCVRFYERHTWQLSPSLRDWCAAVVSTLAKIIPVVIIGSGLHHDDHMDMNFAGPNIVSLVDAFPLRENLALQAAIIARSVGFVGTYGGTMQLALRLQKPVMGVYESLAGTNAQHYVLTSMLAARLGVACLMGTPAQLDVIRSMMPERLELPQISAGSSSGARA